VDEFDIAAAVEKYDNALLVLRDWYAHDHVTIELPNIGVSGLGDHDSGTKGREIRGAREIMDHNRYLEERLKLPTELKVLSKFGKVRMTATISETYAVRSA
jgi:hypothetical protein